jgi:chromosomal replication initiator protein
VDKLEPETIWKEIIDSLRPEVGEADADLWLNDVEVLGIEDDHFKIQVPNKFFVDHIGSNYQSRIEERLKSKIGAALALQYSVRRNIDNQLPAADPVKVAKPQSSFDLSELDPRYTFESFVVGASNRFAHATAEAVAKKPGQQFNPYFIYGGVGLGKTHLMHSIGHAMKKFHPAARVLYTTSEEFVNEFIDSLRYDKPDSFRNKFRNLDCLLIDDIQFLIAKGRSEEEFFYTFNSLYKSRKQIVVASDCAPKDLSGLEKRLISRLEFGVVSDIKPPDLETRIAILRKKAEAEELSIPDDVTLYIASVLKSNIRELEGALIRLTAFSSLTGVPLTVDVAKEQLKDTVSTNEAVNVRIDTIQRVVAEEWAIELKDMKSKSRRREYAFPRQIAMFLATEMTEMSTTQIGQAFGGRDHSTVLHAKDKIKDLIEKDIYFVEKINKTKEAIKTVDSQ